MGIAYAAALLSSSSVQVIAEGIESQYQLDTLLAAGVQMGQGFFFSVPLIARELQAFYAEAPNAGA